MCTNFKYVFNLWIFKICYLNCLRFLQVRKIGQKLNNLFPKKIKNQSVSQIVFRKSSIADKNYFQYFPVDLYEFFFNNTLQFNLIGLWIKCVLLNCETFLSVRMVVFNLMQYREQKCNIKCSTIVSLRNSQNGFWR